MEDFDIRGGARANRKPKKMLSHPRGSNNNISSRTTAFKPSNLQFSTSTDDDTEENERLCPAGDSEDLAAGSGSGGSGAMSA